MKRLLATGETLARLSGQYPIRIGRMGHRNSIEMLTYVRLK
jgi:hypothetical protein